MERLLAKLEKRKETSRFTMWHHQPMRSSSVIGWRWILVETTGFKVLRISFLILLLRYTTAKFVELKGH